MLDQTKSWDKRPQHANPRMHQRPTALRCQNQRLGCGLPLLEVLLGKLDRTFERSAAVPPNARKLRSERPL